MKLISTLSVLSFAGTIVGRAATTERYNPRRRTTDSEEKSSRAIACTARIRYHYKNDNEETALVGMLSIIP